MSKHIKQFQNESAYNEFRQSQDFELPNLSWCEEENVIKAEGYFVPITALTISGETTFDDNITERTFTAVLSPEDTTDRTVIWSLTGNGQILSQSGLTCTVSLTGNTDYNSTLVVTSVADSSITASVTLTHTSNNLREIQVKYGNTIIGTVLAHDTYDGHSTRLDLNVQYVPSGTTQTGFTVTKTGSSKISVTKYNDKTLQVDAQSITGNVPPSQYYSATVTVTSTANPAIKKQFELHIYSTRR